jgi:hypothetical protein
MSQRYRSQRFAVVSILPSCLLVSRYPAAGLGMPITYRRRKRMGFSMLSTHVLPAAERSIKVRFSR